MPDLIEFLKARLAEDERIASAGPPSPWEMSGLLPFDPIRILAEVEAKRRIIDRLVAAGKADRDEEGTEEGWITASVLISLTTTACLLAQPYANHPDYQEEWRP